MKKPKHLLAGAFALLVLGAACSGDSVSPVPVTPTPGVGPTDMPRMTATPQISQTPLPTRDPEADLAQDILGPWFSEADDGSAALIAEFQAGGQLRLVLNHRGPGRCEEFRTWEVTGASTLETRTGFSECGGLPEDFQVHVGVRVVPGNPRQLVFGVLGHMLVLRSGVPPPVNGLHAEVLLLNAEDDRAMLIPNEADPPPCLNWDGLLRFARQRQPAPLDDDSVAGVADLALQGNDSYGVRDIPGFAGSRLSDIDYFVVRYTGVIDMPAGDVTFSQDFTDDAVAVFIGEDVIEGGGINRAVLVEDFFDSFGFCVDEREQPIRIPGGPTPVEIIYVEFRRRVSLDLKLQFGDQPARDFAQLVDLLHPELP